MLLTEEQFKATMHSRFLNVTNTAETSDPDGFDRYINENLVPELGLMEILEIYSAEDKSFAHVIFSTEKKNVNYIVVMDLQSDAIHGHYILDLGAEHGKQWNKP